MLSRRTCTSVVFLLSVFLFTAGSVSFSAAGGHPDEIDKKAKNLAKGGPAAHKHAPDEVIVRFKPGTRESDKVSAHGVAGGSPIKKLKLVKDLYRVRIPKGAAPEDAVNLYRQHPDVLYAEPNYIVEALGTPDDPSFGSLWGLHNTGQSAGTPDADIDAPEAWDITTGGTDAVVVVIDTGVDYNHADLSENMYRNTADCNNNGVDDDGNGFVDDCYGIDAANNDSNPMDDHFHGTHVAGTIGASGNNAVGVVGVNWKARIMACKFLSAAGSGYISDAIECMNYVSLMKDRGVNIIATSNSWGGGGYSQALYDAIEAHRQRGILFIAAAGNSAVDTGVSPMYPAAYYLPNIVSVAATTNTDAMASFSNYGKQTVHLGAPGQSILSTTPSNTYGTYSGTSMATPHVTGVAALLKAQDPTRDWRAIRNLLLAGGDNTTAMAPKTVTGKRLNAYGALNCANSVVAARIRPFGTTLKGTIGTPIDLATLHVNCAEPNGDVNVTVEPGGGLVTLVDDGFAPDQGTGDGVYSGRWTPLANGTYSLAFPGGDVVTVAVGKPDLVVTSVGNPPPAASPGAVLSVSDTTSNPGGVAATASYTRYYLSADTLWSATDRLMTGSRSVPALAPGVSSSGTATVTVPTTTLAGTYYLLACGDDTKIVAEENETNNCAASSATVQVQLSDLVVSSVGNPPLTAPTGGSFSVSDTTSNSGLGTTIASTTRYYLSADTIWSATDRLLTGSRVVPILAPGGSSAGTVTATVPATTPGGTYYLLACADDVKTVPESNETNNCAASTGTVQVLPADLVVTSVGNPPTSVSPGGGFSASDTTSNQGAGTAGASYTRYYLSTDTLWSATDRLLTGSRVVPILGPGGSSAGTVTATVPATTPGGTYYLLACADDVKTVPESNETNNCAASTGTVQVLPADLVVTSLSNPPAVTAPGGGFSVSDTTANIGGTVGTSYTGYYLSTDTVWNSTDKLLSGVRYVAGLASGASSSGTVTVYVPTTVSAGTYYLLACADYLKYVAESNETNNCTASAATVQVGLPDLVEASVGNPPATALPGDSFSAADTVSNQGLTGAAASTTRFYLSLDAAFGTGDVLLTGTRSVPALAAGVASAGATTVIIPATTPAGTYYLLACADDAKIVTEASETNNCTASASTVTVQAPGGGGACVGTGSLALKGKIENDAGGLAGVTLTLVGPGGCASTTLTAPDGTYILPNLIDGGYTLTPSKGSCAFTPPSATLNLVEDTDIDFASPACFF